jgi:hypothetical protein
MQQHQLKTNLTSQLSGRSASPVAHQDEDSGRKGNGVLNQTSFNEYDKNKIF